MEVQLAESKDSTKYLGTLFGAVPGCYLIAGGFDEIEFGEGDELVVKCTVGGSVIGFWAKVQQKVAVDTILYLLSYPEQIEELNLRKTDRLNVMIPAEVRLSGGDAGNEIDMAFQGFLLNLSDGGCLLSGEGELPADLHCSLKFSLPGGSDTFELSGQIVRVNKLGDRVGNFGIQFGVEAGKSMDLDEVQEWITEKRAFLTC